MTAATGLRVEEVGAAGELSRYLADWDALAERAPGAELFETHPWVSAWLGTYWEGRPLAFLFVYSGDTLVGLAPLLDDRRGEIGCPRSLVAPVNPHARRCGLLADGDPGMVVAAVLSHLGGTRRRARMRLRCCDAAGPVVAAIQERHSLSLIRPKGGSPIIRLEGDWEGYLASRPRHLRHEIARKRKRIATERDVRCVGIGYPAEVEGAMAEVLRIERNSWKHPRGTSLASEPGAAGFYSNLARNCAARGWLRIELLYLDQEPVAHILGAVYRGTYYALKTSYDEAYRAWSPGMVLFQHAIRRAFDDGLTTFDFLGDECRWKDELANDYRLHVDACAFAGMAWRCRWDRVCATRVKPALEERAPAVLALRRRLLERSAGVPETGE